MAKLDFEYVSNKPILNEGDLIKTSNTVYIVTKVEDKFVCIDLSNGDNFWSYTIDDILYEFSSGYNIQRSRYTKIHISEESED